MAGLLALTSYPHSKKVDPEKPPGQINHPPQISSEAVLIAQRGSAYSYQVFASDPDQDRLCYWLIGPKGMTINAEGLVSWIPQKARYLFDLCERHRWPGREGHAGLHPTRSRMNYPTPVRRPSLFCRSAFD